VPGIRTKVWLLDCYPSMSGEGGMTFWIKAENSENIRLKGFHLARKDLRFRSRLRQRRVSVFQIERFGIRVGSQRRQEGADNI